MVLKNIFDKSLSLLGLVLLFPIFIWVSLVLFISYRSINIFFIQNRVGKDGKIFKIYKFRTMINNASINTISVKGDSRITPIGKYLRKYKVDELPELINILLGEMSFVGPRPDVPGYMDKLNTADKVILHLKPGITGPASLKYIAEEELLSSVEDPIEFNNSVIFPDKVRINKLYQEQWSFVLDLKLILHTLLRKPYNEENYFKL